MDVQNLNLQEEGKRKQNRQHYIHCVVLGFFFSPAGGTTDGKSLVKVPKRMRPFLPLSLERDQTLSIEA